MRGTIGNPQLHHRPSRRSPGRVFAYASFAIMVGGWAAFAVALVASRQTLDDVWGWVRELPLLAEAAAWLLAFPFLVGIAIWQAPWDEVLRLLMIAALACAYSFMFVPRNRKA